MRSGGRKTVADEDRQDLTVAVRSCQRAHELLSAPHTPVERADAIAQVRLAHKVLDELLGREARRRQPR